MIEEWEKHIKAEEGKAFCGATIHAFDFYLMDLEHAEGCIEQGSRIQPCPECLDTARNKGG